jgi:peptide/nickel transport system permease protein
MLAFTLRKIGLLIVVIFLVSLGTLFLLDHVPGNAAQVSLGPEATPQQVHAYAHALGLDRPFWSRYVSWIGGITRGNFGRSLANGQSVSTEISRAFPVTVELVILAILFALIIAIPLGVYAGYRARGPLDRTVLVGSSVLFSIPSFLLAIALVYFVALRWRWLPLSGWVPLTSNPEQNFRHALLPALALAGTPAAIFVLVLRNDMVETLNQDFIASAKARGLSTRRVLFHHALRPSMFTLITVAGVTIGALLGGTILIESIFSLPGMGQLAFGAIGNRDYITIRAVVLLFAVVYVVLNTLVDLSYAFLDPRLRT